MPSPLSVRHRPCCLVALVLALGFAAPAVAQQNEPFEVAAWVDHFDFYTIFDTEKSAGLAKILDHVQETGATTILWRNCGGSTMRYPSQIEAHHHPSRLDKRRVADGRDIAGWVRYGEAEVDIVATVVEMCKQRGLKPGIHWPFEETHWAMWTIGRYNFEHPQYWARDAAGQPWWGRVSLAYEPVIEHKLALVDELVDRGIEVLFIDFWANRRLEPGLRIRRSDRGSLPAAIRRGAAHRCSRSAMVPARGRLRDAVSPQAPPAPEGLGPIDRTRRRPPGNCARGRRALATMCGRLAKLDRGRLDRYARHQLCHLGQRSSFGKHSHSLPRSARCG